MSKEVGYQCNLVQLSSNNIRKYAIKINASVDEAIEEIHKIEKELKYAITQKRIKELRELLNPCSIGVYQGGEGRRKYERKPKPVLQETPEQVLPNGPRDSDGYEQPAEMHGLIVPVGTIFIAGSKTDQYPALYRIVRIVDKTYAEIRPLHGKDNLTFSGGAHRQSISGINKCLALKQWCLLNDTPEFLAKLAAYTNVVEREDFKRTDTAVNNADNREFAPSASYIIQLEGAHIPFSPGFTGNCQLTVIGRMDALLTNSTNVKAQLQEVYRVANRKLLLCDINQYNVKKLKERIPQSWIHSITPYKSTNGNDMNLCLIDISKK